MAIVDRRFELDAVSESNDGIVGRLARLARLELGYAETRRVTTAALVAIPVAVAATFALIASIVVLLAGVLAVLFGARWEHLIAVAALDRFAGRRRPAA